MSDLPITTIFKMSGAGNTFVVLDGRGVDMSEFRRVERIRELCAEHATDGLMILDNGDLDFRMEFYNPDGSGGMMCGNGGRCIVAFADWLGIRPADGHLYHFLAPDGPHSAEILSRTAKSGTDCPWRTCPPPDTGRGRGPSNGAPGNLGLLGCSQMGGAGVSEANGVPTGAIRSACWTIRLEMKDVDGVKEMLGGYFLNTGTRHFVKFVEDVEAIDIEKEGKELRWNEAFAPEGANVNFVQVCEDRLKVRTFEKGVEGETLACGTGITASAIAAYVRGNGKTSIHIQAKSGDVLTVDFETSGPESFRNIHLTGPAEFI